MREKGKRVTGIVCASGEKIGSKKCVLDEGGGEKLLKYMCKTNQVPEIEGTRFG
jgi:hypothetical protein